MPRFAEISHSEWSAAPVAVVRAQFADLSIEGFNRGGSLHFGFRPDSCDGRPGTAVSITLRLPLPPLLGGLIRPLLEAQVRRELRAAAAEDKHDIEVRGYPARAQAQGTAMAA